jgi:hypothetical protein
MNEVEIAEEIAESLRREPYHLLRNDCLTKSLRLRAECRRHGIRVRIVWCVLGLARAKLPVLGEVSIPPIHFWAEVKGQRIETSRPIGHSGILGIVPSDIRPIITLRFG